MKEIIPKRNGKLSIDCDGSDSMFSELVLKGVAVVVVTVVLNADVLLIKEELVIPIDNGVEIEALLNTVFVVIVTAVTSDEVEAGLLLKSELVVIVTVLLIVVLLDVNTDEVNVDSELVVVVVLVGMVTVSLS